MDNFERELIDKIDNGERLTEIELSTFVWEIGKVVDRTKHVARRWQQTVTVIKQVDDRFFSIDYEEGLTECQENSYFEQPQEVTKHEYEKTITVTEWKSINREEK